MEKISRYILVFIAVFTLAIFLPRLFWTVYEKPIRKPIMHYSCISNQFMITRGDNEWTDSKGNQCTRDEYEQMLPMMFFKQLLASGTMPDSINGRAIEMRAIAKEKSFFRLKSSEVDAPMPDLYPLFESRPGRAKLDLPEDFFRINWRVDFIEASTNKVLEEKSQLFSAALFHKGFSFPAKIISGLPTPRKSCDEGYLIVDSSDQLFHLKMIKGKPCVKKVEVPDGIKFRQISCVDFKNKDFYAYLFSERNQIFILTQDDYKLIKWPVDGYDPSNCDLKISGDLFNYTVIIEAEDHIKAIALTPDYQLVDTFSESWKTKEQLTEGKIFASLFPASISMTNENSMFVRFNFMLSTGVNWLIFNLSLLVVHILSLYLRKSKLKNHLADLGIVSVCGIYGIIAVYLFQNKFFD
jgi:hypothetical protein